MNTVSAHLFDKNPWWEGAWKTNLISRKKILDRIELSGHNRITLITGLRRIGKTSLIKKYIDILINDKGVNSKYIFYVSLDNFLLDKYNILEIVQEFRSINKIKLDEKVYLFFDEVTYKDSWQQQLKNLHDDERAFIFATSSSSSILRDNKAFLTGRAVTIEVLPLDFEEYLNFKNITIKKSEEYLLKPYFEDYLLRGGIPEYVLKEDKELVSNIVEDIIYKDIIGVHNIRSHQVIKDMFLLLMERAGKQLSVNKIANILDISASQAQKYYELFVDTYLIYPVQRYGTTNEVILSPKKLYAPDIGIRNIYTGFRDKGSLFENYIFLKIKNKNPRYLYEDGIEIDFITEDKFLIESKYYSVMNDKQQKLFDSFQTENKIIVRNVLDLEKIENI